MQGMIAEYERAQITERTRRGRLEKARRGEFMPWAYQCYGYRYRPKRHGCAAQVMIEPAEAEVVRAIYRALVEEQLSCRQITKQLNASQTATPTGKNHVWQVATVRNILTHRVYTGQARYNYRQSVVPQYRKTAKHQLRSLKTGRSYRTESAWIWSEAPAIITVELFDKAQQQLRRNVATARKMYQPTSGRYLLRTLVKCGECGLGMVGIRHLSTCKKYDYLYYECAGHAPLTVGRPTKCPATLVRAERLDAVVWQALEQLLQNPSLIPQLYQTWATAKQQTLSGLEAHQAQLLQRRQRIERQDQRLLDAYQAEIITLRELQTRRQKLAATLQQIEQESRQLAHTRQQSVQWQQVIDNATTFRQLLGTNLVQLSFEERQAIAQCLISKVVVTGEEVEVHFLLPFDSTPQVAQRLHKAPEGAPGHFYRLRLAHFQVPLVPWLGASMLELIRVVLPKFQTPLTDGFMGDIDPAFKQQLLHVAVTQREAIIEPDAMADDFAGKAVIFVALGVSGWRHIWLPILEFDGAGREASSGVSISRVRKQGQQLDSAGSTT